MVFAATPALHWLSLSLGASPQDVQPEALLGREMQKPGICAPVQEQLQVGGWGQGTAEAKDSPTLLNFAPQETPLPILPSFLNHGSFVMLFLYFLHPYQNLWGSVLAASCLPK